MRQVSVGIHVQLAIHVGAEHGEQRLVAATRGIGLDRHTQINPHGIGRAIPVAIHVPGSVEQGRVHGRIVGQDVVGPRPTQFARVINDASAIIIDAAHARGRIQARCPPHGSEVRISTVKIRVIPGHRPKDNRPTEIAVPRRVRVRRARVPHPRVMVLPIIDQRHLMKTGEHANAARIGRIGD